MPESRTVRTARMAHATAARLVKHNPHDLITARAAERARSDYLEARAVDAIENALAFVDTLTLTATSRLRVANMLAAAV